MSSNGNGLEKPIAIYYEHPDWFRPLFQQLDERGTNWVKIDARHHYYDAASQEREFSLLFNRMSPSAWQRGLAHAIFYTLNYLAHLEAKRVRVVNGYRCFAHEISKAQQLTNLEKLGLPYPKSRVINHPSQALAAAEAVGYPVVLKPNIGGSGAGIRRFDTFLSLVEASEDPSLADSVDGTLLLQEYHPPRNRSIVRVETLEHRYLYGIRVHLGDEEGFDLCPADLCKTTDGRELTSSACPADAVKRGLSVEPYEPPRDIIDAVERIAAAAHLDVGGIEYLESERDGEIYFYDINALSNFVADPVAVVGFDPTARLVDALVARAESAS